MSHGLGFTSFPTIRLPNLDANAALALGTAIVAAAEGVSLSEGAQEALFDVATALEATMSIKARKLEPPPRGRAEARRADIQLDAAWASTHGLLMAWAKLPNEPKAEVAARLRDRLFPDGLKFTQIAFTKQWAESERRLALIEDEGLDRHFEALGAGPFLDALHATHHAYGEALGITKARDWREDEPTLRAAITELSDALRRYMLQVSAMVRRSDAESAEVARKLLLPIESFRRPRAKRQEDAALPNEDKGEGGCSDEGSS